MSIEAREQLVDSRYLFFESQSQQDDLLNPDLTQTGLIALLQELTGKGHILQLTAVKADHSNDSALGEHCHYNGYAVDCWPLKSFTPGDWLDANDYRFQQFLSDLATSSYLHQIGLAGSAWTGTNQTAAKGMAFEDTGADHVHIGAVNP